MWVRGQKLLFLFLIDTKVFGGWYDDKMIRSSLTADLCWINVYIQVRTIKFILVFIKVKIDLKYTFSSSWVMACVIGTCVADRTVQRRGGVGVWMRHGHGSSPALSDSPGSAIWDTHQQSRRPLCPVPSLWTGQRGCLTWQVINSFGVPPCLYKCYLPQW